METAKEVFYNQDSDVVGKEEDWINMQISCSVQVKSNDLTESQICLQLSKDSQLELKIGNFRMLNASEIPRETRLQAQVESINQEVFDLIEKIQSQN
jgi:cyanate lyase